LENNKQVLKRIAELLKPGGLFISSTPCLKEKMRFLNKFELSFYLLIRKIGLIPLYLKRFKFSELEELIGNGDFQIVETEKLYHRLSFSYTVAKKI
jgi:2-polyprenyl-3-methyl-5-hydroxy-6-metoxy-1,4-benzoquinol methylase